MPIELRNTRQKDAIRLAFTSADRPLSPKRPTGFRVTGHEFFLYGLCAECH